MCVLLGGVGGGVFVARPAAETLIRLHLNPSSSLQLLPAHQHYLFGTIFSPAVILFSYLFIFWLFYDSNGLLFLCAVDTAALVSPSYSSWLCILAFVLGVLDLVFCMSFHTLPSSYFRLSLFSWRKFDCIQLFSCPKQWVSLIEPHSNLKETNKSVICIAVLGNIAAYDSTVGDVFRGWTTVLQCSKPEGVLIYGQPWKQHFEIWLLTKRKLYQINPAQFYTLSLRVFIAIEWINWLAPELIFYDSVFRLIFTLILLLPTSFRGVSALRLQFVLKQLLAILQNYPKQHILWINDKTMPTHLVSHICDDI